MGFDSRRVLRRGNVDPGVWQQIIGAQRSLYVAAVFDEITVASTPYDQLHEAGVDICGYVYSDMGQQPIDTVKRTISGWFGAFPNLSGMFVDVGPPTNPNDPAPQEPDSVLEYYQDVAYTIRSSGPPSQPPPAVMLNCGGLRDVRFANTCFDIAVWEQDWPTYQSDSWWQGAMSNGGAWWLTAEVNLEVSVAHVVNGISLGDSQVMTQAVALAKQRAADWLYVFDGSSAANAGGYGRLPSFWAEEVAAIAGTANDAEERTRRRRVYERRKSEKRFPRQAL